MLICLLRISKHSDNAVTTTGLRAWGLGRHQLTPGALRVGGGSAGSGKGRGWRAVGSRVLQGGTLCIRKNTQGQRDCQMVKPNNHGTCNSSSIFSVGSSVVSLNSSL